MPASINGVVFFFGTVFVFKNTTNQRLILDAAPASLPTRIIGLFPVVFLKDFKKRRFHNPTGYMLVLILIRWHAMCDRLYALNISSNALSHDKAYLDSIIHDIFQVGRY